MSNKGDNVVQFRKPVTINIGVIIFIFLFFYVVVCIWIYFTTPQIVAHEVQIGTLTASTRYKGFIVRDETIVTSEYDGYINYFVREGERIGVNNMVCTVDETGTLNDYITEQTMENSLQSTQDYDIIRREIVQFTNTFQENDFDKVYDFKHSVSGTVQRLSNTKLLDQINQISTSMQQNIHFIRATTTGLVVYNTDGYEYFTEDLLSPDIFDSSSYDKEQYLGNRLVIHGDPIYKVLTSETWSVYMELDSSTAGMVTDGEYIEVRFLDIQDTSWAQIYVIEQEGQLYGRLDFNNSMIRFASERYLDFELIMEEDMGFKIPRSAIAEREFFLIPKEYIISQGSTSNVGVMKEFYTEGGTQTVDFVNVTIYNESDTDYYIDSIYLSSGDYIVKPDSLETYPISKRGTLIGVYNINKGYADFNQITILYQNEEYAIVESNTKYGLNVYDYIVLDAVSVEADDFIY